MRVSGLEISKIVSILSYFNINVENGLASMCLLLEFIRCVYFGLCGNSSLICFAIESQNVPVSSF